MDTIGSWFPRYNDDISRVNAFWSGQGRTMVSLYPIGKSYRQFFDNAAIRKAVPEQLKAQGGLPGISIPTLWPDYGTVSTAKYWGCVPRFDSTGGNIFVDPVAQTMEEALALTPIPVDDPEQDAARALTVFKQLKEDLGTDRLWLRTPDMQGPLNTAAMMMNQEELLMAMYESPDELHVFLEKVTTFLICYAQYLHNGSGNRVLGNIWPYTVFPNERGLSLTEDLMPLLSSDCYAEFGIPCLRKLAVAFRGLHIHCCGEFGRHVPALAAAGLPIRAIEFHYPFTKVEQLLPLIEKGTVLVPYFNEEKGKAGYPDAYAFYRDILKCAPPAARFWFAIPDDGPAAREFAAELGYNG
jgi:hypothetical protein